ncbi:hypothetical protein GCM10023092_12900 [Rurimicrobium arvi]|uniref:Trimeric autotransporter adhesin YadA-like head domain-containing protein n=1 Tax=Rurimicrobium arvi TaxID=2049916 RepID=A0ABP8MMX5_9BACT
MLFVAIGKVNAQVSSENLVNIHNLNSTQISALISPAKGSLVYNTDSNKLFVFDGTLWVATASVDTTSLSTRINQRVKYADTASMLIGYVRKGDTSAMLGNYLNGAVNGVIKSGQNVKLGGSLTEATTITTSGTNTLSVTGLQSGASTDSLMTVTAAGVVKRISPTVLTSTGVKYSDTASMLTPYLRKGDTTAMLSPYLRSALGVKYTDTSSMLTNYVNTSSNGITKSGKNVKLGGTLSEATTLGTSAANTFSLTGLQSGASTDSLMTVTAAGVVKRISPTVLTSTGVKYSDTASMLTPYLRKGDTTAMLSSYLRSALGVKYTDTSSMLGNYVNGSTNGITKSGQNVKLGGSLTEATTITTSGTNTLTLAGLQSGASTDSLMTITTAGVVKRISPTVLTSTGVKYSDTASMLTPYLRKGDTTAMLSPYLRSALGVKYTDTASMLGNYLNGAVNGVTKSGQNVKLGGSLTEATTITTSGTNTLTLAGLQSGASTDSLMTVTAAGVVKRISPSVLTSTGVKYSDTASMLNPYLRKGDTTAMLSPYLRSALGVKYTDTASMLGNYVNGSTNGITKSGQNVKLGGSLTEATTITTSGTNTLTLAGLQSGASTDSLMTVTAAGVVKRISPTVLTSTGVKYSDTASMLTPYLRSALGVKYADTSSMLGNYVNGSTNGITKSGQNVKLGGSLTEATTITTSGTNTLTLAGLQSGASTDSLMTVTAAGVVKRISPTVLTSTGVKYSDTAAMLSPYLRDGDTVSLLTNYVNTASNGITKTGKNVKLGGSLTEATTITTSGTNTLTLAGLQSGASTDSLMTVTAAGVVKRISPSVLTSTGVKYSDTASMLTPYLRKGDTTAMLSPYLRSALGVKYTDTSSMLGNYVNGSTNGITKSGQNVKLGGTLSEATTLVTSAANTFSLTGLQSGAATDSIMTITAAGVVKRINPSVLSSSGVKYTDTASMLSPYLRSAIGVKYTDTSSMLGNYVNGATNGITKSGQNVKLGGSLTEATTIATTATNTLSLTGLQSGSFSDSFLTINAGGVVRKTSVLTYTGTVMQYSDTAAMLAPYMRDADTTAMLNNYINQANNGLTKSGKTVQLGGNLTGATTITNNSNALTFATGGSALNITGLSSGATTDSLLTVNPSTGRVNRIAPSVFTKADSTTASNGLTLTGKDVRLGGSLTAATTLTATASNTLAVSGLQSGSANDSIVVADATTGVLKRIAASRLSSGTTDWSTNGNSGTSATTNFIGTTDNADLVFKANNVESGRLSVYNLSATFGYSSVAAYKSTAFGSSATTSASTEATAIGYNAQANAYRGLAVGSDAKATNNNAVAVGQSSTAGYQATALGSGASATGNNSTAIGFGAATAQANAIVLGGSSAQVGIGTSTPGYALDVTATSNPLKLSGVQSGASTDSLLTINATTGVVRRVNPTLFSTSASNGLTMTGTNIALGGNLTAATTITNNANTLTFATGGSALNITGLAAGVSTDSVLTINASTGRVNRINAAAFTTTASNGLTMSGADARLGGSLTAATTITTSATNTLSLAGLQTSSLNDSVMMISSGNVVRRINAASVALEPFNVVGSTTKASSNTQNIYTSGNMSVGKSSNSATLEVGGKVKADSSVTAPNFVATFQDFGSTGGTITWNMQSGATAAVRLTSNGTLSITNVTAGMYGLIKVQQDGTGGRTIALPSGSKVINGGGATATLTSAANSVDILSFFYDGTNYWWTIGNNYN